MAARMIHRGPDSEGIWCDQYVGLVQGRLLIIDPEAGKQSISNEDGSVWVVLYGEIYNLRELGRKLELQRHVFKRASDTKVLIHGYKQCGKEFLVRRWE